CGGARDSETSWGRALASTAAHSTLSFGGLNAEFPKAGTAADTDHPMVTRHEEEGNVWLDLNSEGYLNSAGIRHRRRLYMDASGLALRGEDQIIPVREPSVSHPQFYLRFHLHPELSISKSAGGKNILIRTPGGTGWKFLTGAGSLTLEESVYCAAPGERRRNQQIVITGALTGQEPLMIKWALSRLSD
ncbi:MAG: heparinase, partial [Alphaproteobacteria bacterium]